MASEKRLDLIDRNALLDSHWWESLTDDFDKARARIIVMSAPTVDAVEVVRCKDCTYWDKAVVNKKGFLICPASGMEIKCDDFCSYAERREGE